MTQNKFWQAHRIAQQPEPAKAPVKPGLVARQKQLSRAMDTHRDTLDSLSNDPSNPRLIERLQEAQQGDEVARNALKRQQKVNKSGY